MLKVVQAAWAGDSKVKPAFSDGSEGIDDFAPLLLKDTSLTVPVREPNAFTRFFLELGALCWPHGLEFNGASLHRDLQET